ncbi:MAG: putative DNA binding domain-containing protein [Desulfobacterales bacterium]|uniref:Putative DNA binding domain-containing protein n=1 Tax=Candidatus Desulfatibia vada TaxID=2841696 RepID=A0A8J6P0W5_9BACT|nr:putative DNA binding domain-containing protein [Candidatus Desulfatibia vada]MBL6970976.1 putative DNA binding domain-containing protein [Desulfobacterales bacterium]
MADLKALIKQSEGISVEFKECRRTINRDVYATVCAFLNRHGGTLLLGVSDAGAVTGVDSDCVGQIKKDFVTAINNPQKINPACYLSVDEVQIDGKTVLHIFAPESSQVHRCNGRIFDRNEDGNLDITDHTQLVAELYHRKQTTYSENKIYPYATLQHLRNDLIAKVRKMAGFQREDHPWLAMDDMELLKSAQLYQTNPETGKSGMTLAGILLLCKDEVILSAVPHHRTDLILRKVNLDRYDDRDFVSTNLIEAYERIMAFVAKHLPDPFYLEGDMRISIRDAIFREVASNILIHREYMNAFPAKLIIERGQVRTENSNNPHGFGLINPETFSPFPKNPVIARFFREIGRADELGSGVRKLMKYGKAYGGSDPELVEGDIFRIIVKCPDFETRQSDPTELRPETEAQSKAQSKAQSGAILQALGKRPLSASELTKILGLRSKTGAFKRTIKELMDRKSIEYTIPDKPNSRLQKYRLTDAGKHLLKSMQE